MDAVIDASCTVQAATTRAPAASRHLNVHLNEWFVFDEQDRMFV